MSKKKESTNDLKMVTQLLQNLLMIELWRGGVSQAEIGKRLGVATSTVNGVLKGVSKEVSVVSGKEKSRGACK